VKRGELGTDIQDRWRDSLRAVPGGLHETRSSQFSYPADERPEWSYRRKRRFETIRSCKRFVTVLWLTGSFFLALAFTGLPFRQSLVSSIR